MSEKLEDIEELEEKTIENAREHTAGFTLEFEDGTEVKFGDNSGIGIDMYLR